MRLSTFGTALVIMGLGVGSAWAQSQPAQQRQGQNQAFCLQGSTGQANCSFATMADCEKSKTGQSDQCNRNPRVTTGSGAGSAAPTTGAAPATNQSQSSAPGTGTSTPTPGGPAGAPTRPAR